MGNEMGNSNVSGLQEEDNKTTALEAPEKSTQVAVHANNVIEETQINPAVEDKDYHEKVIGLDSDDPSRLEDPQIDNQKAKTEAEQDEAQDGEIQAASSSKDVGNEERPIQSESEVSIIETSNYQEQKLQDSNSEENLSETSDHQIQKQISITREEEEARTSSFDTKPVTLNSEVLKSDDPEFDQGELANIYADPDVEDHTESQSIIEEAQGLKSACQNEGKGHSLDTEITHGLADYVVFDVDPDMKKDKGDLLINEMASQEEKILDTSIDKEKFEDEDEEEVGIGCNGVLFTEVNLNENQSSITESEAIPPSDAPSCNEVSEAEDKCMVLTEATKLIGNESEVDKLASNTHPICDELVKDSKTTGEASPSESETTYFNLESNEQEGMEAFSCYPGEVSTELTVSNHNLERGEPIEKEITEAIEEEKQEDAQATGNDTEGIKLSEEENCNDFPTNSVAEAMKFAVELEKEKSWHDLSQYCNERNQVTIAENDIPPEQSEGQCTKSETSAISSRVYEAQESMGRFNKESSSQNLNPPIKIQKCPSFNFDLFVGTRAEESDQTPLLYQEKSATRSFSSRGVGETKYIHDPSKFQPISVEEKAIPFEKSDTEKLSTPFVSLMKKEEEAHINSIDAAQKATEELSNSPMTKEATSTSPRRREKRKPRSSIFTNCMCCAAVIN